MRKLSLLALILGLAACRDSGKGGDDTGGVDTNTGGADDTIQSIQDPAMTSGTPVTVKGVVVTAIDAYGGKTGDFWIQEPDGGEFSGIHVFGAPVDQVAGLALGDVIDIKGAEKDEFVYMGTNGSGGFQPGYGITELKPVSGGMMTVTKTGANMVLQPTAVDALAIGKMSDFMARDAEWEKWEGVLIKVDNVLAQEDQDCVGSKCTDPTLQGIKITGGVVIESSMAAFPADYKAAGALKRGDCIGSVTGVVDYFFDYQLLPRTTAEFGTMGTGCPVENTTATCTDGMDNDGNGFADCNDNGCILGEASCRPATTITAIQTATTPPAGGVSLTDVRVMALSYNKKNMWVSTNLAAAPNEGLYIYGPGQLLTAFTVGSKVNIIGKVVEFNDTTGTETLTELKALSIVAGSNGGGTAILGAAVASPAPLQSGTTGESYESVLVTFANVKVTTLGKFCSGTTVPPACNYGVGAIAVGATSPVTVRTDDDIATLGPAGTCYASVTGIWTYFPYDDEYGFLPTSTVGAGPGTGSCP